MAAEAPLIIDRLDLTKTRNTPKSSNFFTKRRSLVVLGATLALAGCGSSNEHRSAGTKTDGPAETNILTTSVGPTSAQHNGRVYEEIADNPNGVPLFSSPQGGAVPNGTPGRITYGTHVEVACYVPNESGMSSVNDFYLIKGGVHGHLKSIRDTYASANTFANGGPMGNNPDTIDPHVPKC